MLGVVDKRQRNGANDAGRHGDIGLTGPADKWQNNPSSAFGDVPGDIQIVSSRSQIVDSLAPVLLFVLLEECHRVLVVRINDEICRIITSETKILHSHPSQSSTKH